MRQEIRRKARIGPSQVAALIGRYPEASIRRAVRPIVLQVTRPDESLRMPDPGPAPFYLTLEVTQLCNLRCKMCWFWGEKGRGDAYGPTNELGPSDYESMIVSLARYKPWIFVTGGETMLRSSSVRTIAEMASKHGMPVSVISNGTLDDHGCLERLVELPIASLAFSIDGPEGIHDSIRGAGSYARTRATVRRVATRRGSRDLPVLSLNFTITPWNHTVAPEMIRVAEEFGVDRITLQHLWYTSPQQASEEAALLHRRLGIDMRSIAGHVISHDFPDVARLVESVDRVRSAAEDSPVRVGFYPDLGNDDVRRYYTEPKFSPLSRCLSPWSGFVVKPNGDAMFCPDLWITEYVVGNVRESPIPDLWRSPKAEEFRKVLWSERMFPACNRCCSLYGQ